jgi:hypothetical protein
MGYFTVRSELKSKRLLHSDSTSGRGLSTAFWFRAPQLSLSE